MSSNADIPGMSSNADVLAKTGERSQFGHHMLVRSSSDLGAVIRDKRKQLKLNQAALAKKIAVSRQWVIDVEKGHARAELGLVLRAIDALDIELDARADKSSHVSPRGVGPADLAAIIARAKKARP